jgi:chorismate-pyruvate lyase
MRARVTTGVVLPLAVIAATSLGFGLRAQDAPRWPDTYVARLEALALMQTLNAEILANRSATAALEAWCRSHRLADPAQIRAIRVPGISKAPSADQRTRLEISPQDDVEYRRVELRCGTEVLSEADNWFVPSRLTPEMNALLDTTETPFGRVVQSLQPYRRTFAVTLLWSPLPDGWDRATATPAATPATPLAIPEALFEHRAVLYTHDHRPFAEVREIYRRQVLGRR